jgi:hypothetical protein
MTDNSIADPQVDIKDSSDATPLTQSVGRRRLGTLALFGSVFVVQSLSPTPQVGDSRLSVVTAWQFITHLNLHLEGYRNVRNLSNRYDLVHHSGHLLPFFPWPTMLLAAPADILFALVGHHPQLLSISNPNRTFLLEIPTASFIVAMTAVIIRSIVLGLGKPWGTPRVALLVALVYAFTTSAWSIGSRALWQQTASMLFLSASLLALQRIDRSSRWPLLLGIVRPTNYITVILAVAWVIWRRRTKLVAVLGGLVVCVIPFVIVSLTQYGQILPPYYLPSRLGEVGPLSFWNALLVNMVSPNRGLLIYDPLLVLAVIGVVMRKRSGSLRDLDLLMIGAIVGQWIVVAAYGSTGGATYGPRLMLDIVPFLAVLSVPAVSAFVDALRGPSPFWRSTLAVVVTIALVWGLFINGTGAVFRDGYCWSAYPVTVDSHPSRVWDWSNTQFLRPYLDIEADRSIEKVVAGSCLSSKT